MFSVLMSCYKNDNPEFLEEALQSVLKQTIPPIEVVMVKDGPVTLELEHVISCFENFFNKAGINFLVIPLEVNVGLGLALQQGLQMCSQQFIVRMDSDDISRDNRLKMLKEAVYENPAVGVFGSQIEEFSVRIGDLNRKRVVPLEQSEIHRYSKFRNPMNHVSVCFKREVVVSAGGYEPMLWFEDYFLWLKLLNKKISFLNLDQTHVDVRVNTLSGRRSGRDYLKAEFQFCKAAWINNYWSFGSAVIYFLPRIVIRILPSSTITYLYKYLRK
jgi:glycosyltransferase involved in cell wall biosynthesis